MGDGFCRSQLDLFRATAMVFSDPGPPGGAVDGANLFGHTPDEEESILTMGAKLWRDRYTKNLLLCGGDVYAPHGVNAYSGGKAWTDWLVRRGVDRATITALPRPELSHTGTEAKALIDHAVESEWRTISVTCCPQHQLRGFLAAVTFAVKVENLRVYSKPGLPQNWWARTAGSQGVVLGTRFDTQLEGEWDRINRVYGNEYDLISCAELFRYLEWRDSGDGGS